MKWTRERLIEEGRKYSSCREFREKQAWAYERARAMGLLSEMPWLEKVREYHKLDGYEEKARECGSRRRFIRMYPSLYRNLCELRKWRELANKMGWEDIPKPFGYWTKERCFDAARRCETIGQFNREYHSAYCAIYKLGLIEELRLEMGWIKKGGS